MQAAVTHRAMDIGRTRDIPRVPAFVRQNRYKIAINRY